MAALWNLASSAVTAVKDVLVGAIGAEQQPVRVVQRSSKAPSTRSQNRKKIAAAKKLAAKKKAAAQKRDGSNSAALVTEAPSGPEEDDQTESVEEKVVKGEAKGSVSSASSDEAAPSAESAEVKEEEEDETKAAALAEKKRKEREKRKDKAKAKKAQLATSIIHNLPTDPLIEPRARLLETLEANFEKLPKITADTPAKDIKLLVPDNQRALEEMLATVEVKVKEMLRKLPRCSAASRSMSVQTLKAQIQKMEFAPDREELLVARKFEDLQGLIAGVNHEAFMVKVQEFKTKASAQLELNRDLLRSAIDNESRERVATRLNNIMEMSAGESAEKPAPIAIGQLESKKLDLNQASASALFVPHNMGRRLERKHKVVLEQGSRQGAGSNAGRSVTIWGLRPNVTAAAAFIQTAEANGVQKRSYEKKFTGTIIGRGGAGINKLDADVDALVNVDTTVEVAVVAFGTEKGCESIFERVDELVKTNSTQQERQVTGDVPVDALVARALTALHRAKAQKLETELKCKLTVLTNPSDGKPRILVRTTSETQAVALERVRDELVAPFVTLTFPGPVRGITRVVFPPRNAAETSQNKLIHDEFQALRDARSLFVDRLEGMGKEADAVIDLNIVCHTMDREEVERRVPGLIERASYLVVRVPVEKEQLRVFTQDSRALIETSSQCRVSVSTNASTGAASLSLMGNEKAIESAKTAIAEMLAKEGKVEEYKFADPDVMGVILRDRAARLRALEAETRVTISVTRATQSATLVGPEAGIEHCKAALDEVAAELSTKRARTHSLIMTLDSNKIPQLIGKGGSQIREIREATGIDDIRVPQRDDTADTVDVTITGTREAVGVAQRMIERALNLGRPRETDDEGSLSGSMEDDHVKTSPVQRRQSGRRQGGNSSAPPRRGSSGSGTGASTSANQNKKTDAPAETFQQIKTLESETDFPPIAVSFAPPQAVGAAVVETETITEF